MSGETPSQPGWYPDQNGTMRWFDGASWTDHVQPGAGGSEATVVQAGPEPTARFEQQPAWQGGLPPASPPPPSGPPSGPPPPAGPPAGPPPGSPYGAVPQPSFPGGPGGPGGPGYGSPGYPPPSSGGNRKLLIILAIVGAIVLVAVLAVGSWAIFVRDSDDDDNGRDSSGENGSLPDEGPEEVVEAYVQAIKDNDCQAALDLLSESFIAEEDANCDDETDFMTDEEFDYEVGETTIDEDAETATVQFRVIADGFEEEVPIGLVVEDDEWKIDSFEVADTTTDGPTDAPSTDLPTDLPTDIPTDLSDFPSDFTDFPTDYSDYLSDLPTDFPTDPSELESYLSDYFSEFLTFTG
ncbi:hypothetical protein DJ010_08625 [Nocardioides silvaticus]|uniref:DUF2510 domain-containing protein n=1 Tax=Nocardioides silvaticus TaxID=2201891 RepID=A0A316THA9_9ACTN|nr:DUF2510 domain-containing protein [Nocardioides silvaticus]PWN03178.1 hypothetical protein DJ010_08625 [Nocardioides silvaticus]